MYIRRGFVILFSAVVILLSTAFGYVGYHIGLSGVPPTVVTSAGYDQVRSAFLACMETVAMR